MAADGFGVDLPALLQVAQGTADLVAAFDKANLADAGPPASAWGNAVALEGWKVFSERWELGLKNLVDDVREVSNRLGQVVQTYADFEEESQATLARASAPVDAVEPPAPASSPAETLLGP